MNTTEHGQREMEKISHGRSPIPGMHGTLKRISTKMTSLTKNMKKKTPGILMTQPTDPTTRSSSPLKNYRYIYFAFLEIIIEVHITLIEINSEGRYGMHGAMGRKKPEHSLVNLSKN